MQEAGITLSTIGTGGGSAQILRAAGRGVGRPLLRRRRRDHDPRHLPARDDPHRRRADRGGDVPADPLGDLRDPRRPRRRPASAAARLQRHDRQGHRRPSSLLTAREDPLLAQWQYGLGRAVGVDDRRAPAVGHALDRHRRVRHPHRAARGMDSSPAGRARESTSASRPASDGELNVEVTSFDDDGGAA